MATRRESSDILYPFVPGAEPVRDYLKGIKDITCIVRLPAYTPNPNPMDPANHGYKPYYVTLEQILVSSGNSLYIFRGVTPTTSNTFSIAVTHDQGLVRVSDYSVAIGNVFNMIIDSSSCYMKDVPGVYTLPQITEVEPCQIVWRTTEVTSIALVNEFRNHDPAKRGNLPPDTQVYKVWSGRLELIDGYNCSLSYDENTHTLLIEGGPGRGRGLPAEIYWDTTPPDVSTGVLTINGIGGGSYTENDVPMDAGMSLIMKRLASGLKFTVKKDNNG